MPLSPTQQKKLQRLALALDGKEAGVLTVLEQVENALEAKIEGIERQIPALRQAEDGKVGAKGDKGDSIKGDKGDRGEKGKDGIGTKGKDGTNGRDGKDGVDGINGINGVDGINGTNGVDGFVDEAVVAYLEDEIKRVDSKPTNFGKVIREIRAGDNVTIDESVPGRPLISATQDISGKQNVLAEGAFVDGDKTKLDGLGGFTMNLLELTQTTMQNHDSTADLAIEWKTLDRADSNFTHSVTTDSEQITCVTAGWLDVRYTIIYEQDGSARLNTEAYVTLNGTRVEKSVSRKTYYRGVVYGKHGDESKAFYLQVAADDVIEVHSGVAEGNTGFTLTRPMDTVPTMTNIQIRFLG